MADAPAAGRPVLTLPGWTGSGPGHWQSLWERDHPDWRRVEQRDWERPEPVEWLATAAAALAALHGAGERPPLLLGHSLGAVLIAMLAQRHPEWPIGAAFLVAPADVETAEAAAPLRAFAPLPMLRLPFPSVLVASRDDPFLAWPRAEALARAWGSELVDAGFANHLHTAAGYGPWPEGLARVRELGARGN